MTHLLEEEKGPWSAAPACSLFFQSEVIWSECVRCPAPSSSLKEWRRRYFLSRQHYRKSAATSTYRRCSSGGQRRPLCQAFGSCSSRHSPPPPRRSVQPSRLIRFPLREIEGIHTRTWSFLLFMRGLVPTDYWLNFRFLLIEIFKSPEDLVFF